MLADVLADVQRYQIPLPFPTKPSPVGMSREREEGAGMRTRKPSGCRSKTVECRFSNCICLQLGKLLILASHRGLKQDGLSFLLS